MGQVQTKGLCYVNTYLRNRECCETMYLKKEERICSPATWGPFTHTPGTEARTFWSKLPIIHFSSSVLSNFICNCLLRRKPFQLTSRPCTLNDLSHQKAATPLSLAQSQRQSVPQSHLQKAQVSTWHNSLSKRKISV